MTPLDRRHFTKPIAAAGILTLIVMPALAMYILYAFYPTSYLDNSPRLLFGKSSTSASSSSGASPSFGGGGGGGGSGVVVRSRTPTVAISKEMSQQIMPHTLLGYSSPVSTDNAIVAYSPRELFSSVTSSNQIMWFGVVCPLTPDEANAYEVTAVADAKKRKEKAPQWVFSRPLYSFDCTRDYPHGFDFTVIAKLPMYHMQQFRLEMWSGRETPMSGIRALSNMSIADYRVASSAADGRSLRNGMAALNGVVSALASPPAPSSSNSIWKNKKEDEDTSRRLAGQGNNDAGDITEVSLQMAARYGGGGHRKAHGGDDPSERRVAHEDRRTDTIATSRPITNNQEQPSIPQPFVPNAGDPYTYKELAPPEESPPVPPSKDEPTVGNFVSSSAGTEIIKTCDKITDECVQASMFTYTRSYKLMHPQTRGVGYNGRLVAQQPGSDGLWQIGLSADLGKIIAEVDVIIIAEPARYSRSSIFRFVAGLMCLAVFLALFVSVKLIGLYMRDRDTTRIFSVIDPSHDEIVHEGWEDLRRLWQYWVFTASEARSRWAARRRRYRRTAANENAAGSNQTDTSATVDSSSFAVNLERNNEPPTALNVPVDENGVPLTPRSILAAKAKASQAAGPIGGYPSSSEEEGDVCRICRVGEPTSDLVAPCACSGTSRYIHRSCLEQWRSMTSNSEHRRVCAECKAEYNVPQEVPQRSLAERFIKVMSPFLKLTAILLSFVLFGYVIKVIGFATSGGDPHIDWSINFYHIFMGSLALCSIMIVFSNGLWFVIDFPKTIYQRLPALIFLGVVGPILLGYMAQLWCAIVFETVLTPEISFGVGVFTFVAFVNNAVVKLADVLTPTLEPLRRRHADAVPEPSVVGGTTDAAGGNATADAAEVGEVGITAASLTAHNNILSGGTSQPNEIGDMAVVSSMHNNTDANSPDADAEARARSRGGRGRGTGAGGSTTNASGGSSPSLAVGGAGSSPSSAEPRHSVVVVVRDPLQASSSDVHPTLLSSVSSISAVESASASGGGVRRRTPSRGSAGSNNNINANSPISRLASHIASPNREHPLSLEIEMQPATTTASTATPPPSLLEGARH